MWTASIRRLAFAQKISGTKEKPADGANAAVSCSFIQRTAAASKFAGTSAMPLDNAVSPRSNDLTPSSL